MSNVKLLDTPAEDTQDSIRQSRNYRDEFQRKIDATVEHLIKDWRKAKAPAPDNSPFIRLTVVKSDVSELKRVIRSAFTLHGHLPVFWNDAKGEDGNVTVKFAPMAKPEPVADTPAPAAGAPAGDAPAADAPAGDAAKG